MTDEYAEREAFIGDQVELSKLRARVAEVERDRDVLAKSVLMLQARVSKAREERDAALKRVEELTEAVDRWGHDRECARLQARTEDVSVPCDCNLDYLGLGALSGSVTP